MAVNLEKRYTIEVIVLSGGNFWIVVQGKKTATEARYLWLKIKNWNGGG